MLKIKNKKEKINVTVLWNTATSISRFACEASAISNSTTTNTNLKVWDKTAQGEKGEGGWLTLQGEKEIGLRGCNESENQRQTKETEK